MLNTDVDPYALLQRVRSEPAALEQLADQEHHGLLAWLTGVLRDRDSAEDAVQDTWVMLSRGKWQFTPNSSDTAGDVRAWLRRIALRSALRRRSQNQSRQQLLMRWSRQRINKPAPCPIQDMDQKDRSTILQAALAELPSHLRSAVELRYRDGLAFPDIARKIGGSPVAARVRTWRALRMLRSRLLGIGVLLSGSCTSWTCDLFPTGVKTGIASSKPMWFAWSSATSPHMALLSGVIVGGVTLGLFLFTPSTQSELSVHKTSPPNELSSKSHEDSSLTTKVPAWLYVEDEASPTDQDTQETAKNTSSEIKPSNDGEKILVKVFMFDGDVIRGQFPHERPTILTADQGKKILDQAARNSALLSAPSVLISPRQHADVHVVNQQAFHGGYKEITNGSTSQWEPVIKPINSGIQVELSAAVENNAVRFLSTQCDYAEIIDYNPRKMSASQREFVWAEPITRHQRSAKLPHEGITVPNGSFLLVPTSQSELRYHTPNRRYSEPEVNTGVKWTLFEANVISDESTNAPPLPSESI